MKKTIINIIIAFLLVISLLIFEKFRHNSKVEKWPSVEAVVVYSTVMKKIKNVTFHYKPFVKYSYVVENEKYEVVYYESMSSGYLKEESALEITSRFPEGEKVTVHYNPDDPKDSILADLH